MHAVQYGFFKVPFSLPLSLQSPLTLNPLNPLSLPPPPSLSFSLSLLRHPLPHTPSPLLLFCSVISRLILLSPCNSLYFIENALSKNTNKNQALPCPLLHILIGRITAADLTLCIVGYSSQQKSTRNLTVLSGNSRPEWSLPS